MQLMRWVTTTVFDTFSTQPKLFYLFQKIQDLLGKCRAIYNQIHPSSTCCAKWRGQTERRTLLQRFLKICCLAWRLCHWFWTKEPGPPGSACHPVDWACPWQGIHMYIHRHICIQIKNTRVFLKLQQMCIFVFLFRPGKTTAFFAECPEMAELANTDEWSSTVIWHGTSHVTQVWHQWPRTKVCPFSWELLSWALITGCHPATTADEVGCFGSQIVRSLTLHWQILTLKKVRS